MELLTFEPPPELFTPRTRLRAVLAEDDATPLFRIYADPLATKHLAREPMARVDEMRSKLKSDLKEAKQGDAVRWVICDRMASGALGYVGIFRWSQRNRYAELGYVLARERWGQGLMGEVLPALIEFAFTRMRLHRLEALVDPENKASVRLLQQNGFEQEGLMRERALGDQDHYVDTAITALLEPAWRSRDRSRTA